nr:asparagine synthase C-terminal domain-containing protein [Paenibacillus dendritiformis]
MGYSYIAVIGPDGEYEKHFRRPTDTAFGDLGLQHRYTCGPIKLFTAKGTPTLVIPGQGIVIGHLFSADGSRVERLDNLSNLVSPAEIRTYFLEHYWGEYLLIQADPEAPHGGWLMRDPSGGFPCVYSLRGPLGFVTSDISLATRLNIYRKRIDWDFIAYNLTCPHLKTERTGLIDIWELMPGFSLQLQGFEKTISQEWSPWNLVSRANRFGDFDEAARYVRNAVTSTVAAWADADESILLELSGGLDSSIVGVCLRGTLARTTCCTLVTPVPGADERLYAGRIADHLGIDLHVERLSFDGARFDFVPAPYLVRPRMGPLQYIIETVMRSVGERYDVNSYFLGAGGDTVFCYLRTAAPAADAFKERGLAAGISAVRDLSELHECTYWKAAWLSAWKLLRRPRPPHRIDKTFVAPARAASGPEPHPWFTAPRGAFPGDKERIFDLAATQVFWDSVPRGMVRHLRMPLLSQPVVEACLQVPAWMWIAEGRNRSVARAAFADELPPEVYNRRSKGTFMSYLGAIYQRNKNQMLQFLLSGQLHAHGLLDADALERFVGSNLRARDRSFTKVLDLCTIENWTRHQS